MQAEGPSEFFSLLLPPGDEALVHDDESLTSLSPTSPSSHHLAAAMSGFSSPNSLESVDSLESYFLGTGSLTDVPADLFTSSSSSLHGDDASSSLALMIKPDLDDAAAAANDFFTTTINIKHEPLSSPPSSPLIGDCISSSSAFHLSPPSLYDLSSPEMPASPMLTLSPSSSSSPASVSSNPASSSSSSSATTTTTTTATASSSSKSSSANRKRNFSEMQETDTSKTSTPVTLSREELLNMTSQALEEYTEKLASSRPLTSQEERQFKRQRRLIKNRESAQLSRMRKKHYIEELERQVRDAKQERDQFASQVASLTNENKSLKDEVQYLRNFIKQSPHLSAAASAAAAKSLRAPGPASTQTVKAAGVCLLIILFSFGLFFNANNGPNPTLPSLGRREPIPQVIPPTMNRLYTGRVLHSIVEEDVEEIAAAAAASTTTATAAAVTTDLPVVQQNQITNTRIPTPTTPTAADLKRKLHHDDLDLAEPKAKRSRITVQPEPESESELPATVPIKAEKAALALSTSNAASASSTINGILPHLAKDESVVYCAEAHRILPTGADDQLPLTKRPFPPVFSLLIPPSALNGTVPNVDKLDPNTLLDVTCQILSINVVPTLAVEDLPISTM